MPERRKKLPLWSQASFQTPRDRLSLCPVCEIHCVMVACGIRESVALSMTTLSLTVRKWLAKLVLLNLRVLPFAGKMCMLWTLVQAVSMASHQYCRLYFCAHGVKQIAGIIIRFKIALVVANLSEHVCSRYIIWQSLREPSSPFPPSELCNSGAFVKFIIQWNFCHNTFDICELNIFLS